VDDLRPTEATPSSNWNRVLDINLTGVLHSCLGEFEAMKAHGGAIVNIASISGMIVNRGAAPHAAYSSSKAAVIHLSRCLAVEWAPHAIRVNTVSPGYTRTEMTKRNPKELNRTFADQSPMGRLAEPDEIAAPTVFLLSDGASFVNGANLPVDGAVLAW
jgi:NAD(P)-dependent dehydrogenase (short-subunit alcohol dehydrogenase family)